MDEAERQRLDKQAAEKITSEAMTGDFEMDHINADDILIDLLRQLGFTETIKAYERVTKWYA